MDALRSGDLSWVPDSSPLLPLSAPPPPGGHTARSECARPAGSGPLPSRPSGQAPGPRPTEPNVQDRPRGRRGVTFHLLPALTLALSHAPSTTTARDVLRSNARKRKSITLWPRTREGRGGGSKRSSPHRALKISFGLFLLQRSPTGVEGRRTRKIPDFKARSDSIFRRKKKINVLLAEDKKIKTN